MNKPGPWKCLWTSLKKQTKNENTKMFWGALNTSLFSHNHSKFSAWQESNTTSDITTPFWPGQDGHQFWAQPANFEQLKSSFPLPYTKKGWQCFQVRFKLYYFRAKISQTKISFQYSTSNRYHCCCCWQCIPGAIYR